MSEMSEFARRIYKQKYSMNGTEEWADTARRVVENVFGATPQVSRETIEAVYQLIVERKFMPGGRYLYAAGRELHQVNNCLLLRAEDSREGWADLLHKATMALMTGAGIGVDYSAVRHEGAPIRRTGGKSTGPIALMKMLNEAGRNIMQGGARRSAIYASLNWRHPDVFKFILLKNWSPEVRRLKENDFNFPATMDGTNISVILDKDFFTEYELGDPHAAAVYWGVVRNMLETGEPGFQVDYHNPRESLRNAPVAGGTRVLTSRGYVPVKDIVGVPTSVWTGIQWAPDVVFTQTAADASLVEVAMTNGRAIVCDPDHPFLVRRYLGGGKGKTIQVERVRAADLIEDDKLASDLPQETPEAGAPRDYGHGYVFGDGSVRAGRGDISVHADSKRSAYLRAVRVLEAHSVGEADRAYFKTTVSTKHEWLNSRLTPNFIAGWFDADGCWARGLLRISSTDRPALMLLQESLDGLGIKSVVRRDGIGSYKGTACYTLGVLAASFCRFRDVIPTERVRVELAADYVPYRESEIRVRAVTTLGRREPVYCADVRLPEHSFMAEGVLVSNCTELVSEDDSDVCNLGSLNLGRITTHEEFQSAVALATEFLMAGTVYSDVPYEAVRAVRSKNRRLGLGLMGLHEWLLQRGKPYGADAELGQWMESYQTISKATADRVADSWSLSRPVKTRAIAPTGTIGILAETTSGIEPLFCTAYRRRYKGPDGRSTHYAYVVDQVADRLIQNGIAPEDIEDALTLASDPERRVAFQAWVQQYVDHGISSTLNLPPWGSDLNNEYTVQPFGEMLLRYLPRLRGITVYPDGSRGGQPLVRVEYDTAQKHKDQVFIEQTDSCELSGKGGSCGS